MPKSPLKTLVASIVMALFATLVMAAEIHEPAKGSAERKAILDAMRPSIEKQMKAPVEFVIQSLKSDGKWALLIAEPQRPGGAAIDPEQTAFAGKSDQMDGLTVTALARMKNGKWRRVTDIVGSMDVAYLAWADEFGAPKSLLGFE